MNCSSYFISHKTSRSGSSGNCNEPVICYSSARMATGWSSHCPTCVLYDIGVPIPWQTIFFYYQRPLAPPSPFTLFAGRCLQGRKGRKSSLSSREIAGKTYTFWFDWGPAGERPEVGIRSSSTKLSLSLSLHRKWRASSLPLYVREIDTSGCGRLFGSADFV